MQEDYLAKWLNNELSEAELSEFKKSDEYASYMRILEASNTLEAPEFDMEGAWNTFKERQFTTETKVRPLHPYKQFLKIAAVIAILLAGSYFYLNTLDTTFSTTLAERTEVMLPDNSEVILNADSEVSFHKNKWDKQRAVQLNGEAFFKVAKGKKFTVSTTAGKVTVLGTQFNVENREGFFEVTCYEGLVRVSYQNQELKLPAGNSFLMINGKVRSTEKPNTTSPSWVNNESTFSSIPLKFVLKELERQYNIEVQVKNIDVEQLFTGSFSNTDLKIALESISIPSRISYKLGEANVLFYAENTP